MLLIKSKSRVCLMKEHASNLRNFIDIYSKKVDHCQLPSDIIKLILLYYGHSRNAFILIAKQANRSSQTMQLYEIYTKEQYDMNLWIQYYDSYHIQNSIEHGIQNNTIQAVQRSKMRYCLMEIAMHLEGSKNTAISL